MKQLSKKTNDRHRDGKDWLADAVKMRPMESSSRRLDAFVDAMFEEVASFMKVSSRTRQTKALRAVLLNLINAHHLDRPVRYSRNKNRYTRDRRYGQHHYTYDRLIPIIDALERLGYIEQSSYYKDPDDDRYGLQTRMWGTELLWARCRRYRVTHYFGLALNPPEEKEVIVLRNKEKQDRPYRETHQTRQMRDDLERYNGFIDRNFISVRLTGDSIVDNRWLVENLYQNISKSETWIQSVILNNSHSKYKYTTPIPTFTKHLLPFHTNPYRIIQSTRDRIPINNPIPITNTKRGKVLLDVLLQRFWSEAHFFEKDLYKRSIEIGRIPLDKRRKVLDVKSPLQDIGVDELVFVLDHEHLRRIFNRESWEYGGRAYGALHQSMLRRPMRKNVLIDGEPTVEIDYSAFHIRMLYHREGIDYTDDPYLECEGHEMRDIYKAVGLIAINSTERDACGAIRDELENRGLAPPDREKPYASLVSGFKQTHPAIAHHLFSDVGIRLQNIDSIIMNAILVRLMDNGILGLPVYDSVIVQQQHGTFTREVMTEEYRKQTGFNPKF
ncbi:hypothetical protein [Desulfosudis oleivorans]|nr:hypothetical protein [Desulfosudis oleivorans]